MANAKVIGIVSIKGGVGKTTTVCNLGAVLASKFNKRVLLVDANFSAPNLGLHLGLVDPKHTLNDALADDVPISQALIEHDNGIHVLTASLKDKKINPYKLRNRLQDLKEKYDIILIDSSPAMNEETLSAILASDELFVVSAPDYPTLSCTMQAVQLAKEKNTPISGLIINKSRNKKFEIDIKEIEKSTKTPVLAILPDDIKILESLAHTTPATIRKPNSPASIEYTKLAASLVGKHYTDPRLWKQFTHIFKKSIDQDSVNRLLYAKNLREELENQVSKQKID
ncbi:AAA family ATPase [Candidatus Woesearchaeota archaeon]|nr:AAA family ATPase [Candidatus Woesearchaeota archaeon]MBT7367423.1 AAA family ATPase [Candidatus Woesearchaeota archaeon]